MAAGNLVRICSLLLLQLWGFSPRAVAQELVYSQLHRYKLLTSFLVPACGLRAGLKMPLPMMTLTIPVVS